MAKVFDIHEARFGRRRIAAAVNKGRNEKVSVNRIGRRIKEQNIAGYTPPAFKTTTIPDVLLEDSPNLVKDAKLNGINQIWVSDITFIAAKEGWLYTCTIIGLFS